MSAQRWPAPAADYRFTLKVDVEPAVVVDTTSRGTSLFIPIVGGTVTGEEITAEILPGGGDWANDLSSGEFVVRAKYHLRTDDGAMVAVDNVGVWHERADGTPYFVTTPRFDAPAGRYDWMNRGVFVGMATERSQRRIDIDVYSLSSEGTCE